MHSERRQKSIAQRARSLPALLVVLSCSTFLGLQDGTIQSTCTTSAECAPGYGCLLSVCRNNCNTDAECGVGSRCLKAIGSSACIPSGETCVAGCPDGTRCIDATCRTACELDTDCTSDQICSDARCIGLAPSHETQSSGGSAGAIEVPDGDAGASPAAGGRNAHGGTAGRTSAGTAGEGTTMSVSGGGTGAVEGGASGNKSTAGTAGGAGKGGNAGSAGKGGSAGSAGNAGNAGNAGMPQVMECVPNTTPTQCSGATPQYCDTAGKLQNVTSGACRGATPACVAGVCTPCTPNPTPISCADASTPQFCNAQGQLQSASAACSGSSPVCLNGACVACKPNNTPQSCFNSTPQFCSTSGQWQNVSTGACSAAAPTCSAGSCACNQTVCSSVCLDTNSSASNCGACAHSCLSGTCSAGKCQPFVLASGQTSPGRIAINSSTVYWCNATAPKTINQVHLDGTGLGTLSTSPCTFGIAADDAGVYWSGPDGYSQPLIYKVGVAGGIATPLVSADGFGLRDVAIDSSSVYVATDEGGLIRVPKLGGSKSLLTTEYGISSVVSDGSVVYWTNRDLRAVKSTGSVNATTGAGSSLQQIALHGTDVVYVAGTEIRKIPTTGATSISTVIASVTSGSAYAIAADSSGVYWTTTAGAIQRLDDAGNITTLATGQGSPGGIALDAKAVYWSNPAAGQIMKLAK